MNSKHFSTSHGVTIIILVFIVVFTGGYFMRQLQDSSITSSQAGDSTVTNSAEQAVHYHAMFGVVINGELQDYSSPLYMYAKPCGASDELAPIDRAHLHDEEGRVIHVHDDNVTWQDALVNLNLADTELPEGDWYVYTNQGLTESKVDAVIESYETILFSNTQLQLDTVNTYLASLPSQSEVEAYEENSQEFCSSN